MSYCTSCERNATLAIDHMCYSHCNLVQQYYYNSNCYSICPFGTFVSYTGVHCIDCSILCGTCVGVATNCTSCSDSYYFNNTCVTQCPTGYFGTNNFTCTPCSTSTSSICSQPLNFTTAVSVENYKYVVSVKFNQNVDISKQISDILKVQLKLTRRLLDAATLINDGVPYTY